MDRLQNLIAALWFGSAVFLMISASAAFRAAGNPTIAADVVGSMLTRWHYIALAAPLLLFVLELRRVRPLILLVLFTAVLLAASQSFVDLRIRSIRAATPAGVSNLDPEHPVRKRFGMLHGLSMVLLLSQAIAAGVIVMSRPLPSSAFGTFSPQGGEKAEQTSAEQDPSAFAPPQRGEGAEGG